jgi:hypothetical protein
MNIFIQCIKDINQIYSFGFRFDFYDKLWKLNEREFFNDYNLQGLNKHKLCIHCVGKNFKVSLKKFNSLCSICDVKVKKEIYLDIIQDKHNLSHYTKNYEELTYIFLINNDNFVNFIKRYDTTKDFLCENCIIKNYNLPSNNYIDLCLVCQTQQKKQLYYFDSLGHKPGFRIRKFNNKILNYLLQKKYNKGFNIGKLIKYIRREKDKSPKYITLLNNKINDFDIRYNNIQHQQGNSECGVYSINFIIRSVKGESFDEITRNITSDDKINECRKIYFR